MKIMVVYFLIIIEYLIKSGGGTGPVKPGNLMTFLPYVRKGAKSCGIYPRDEE